MKTAEHYGGFMMFFEIKRGSGSAFGGRLVNGKPQHRWVDFVQWLNEAAVTQKVGEKEKRDVLSSQFVHFLDGFFSLKHCVFCQSFV